MSSYIYYNIGVRSQTLDIMSWNIWRNTDNICVGCRLDAERMSHFMRCKAYCKECKEMNWHAMLGNGFEKQFKISRKYSQEVK